MAKRKHKQEKVNKENVITFRLTVNESQMCFDKAADLGLSMSAMIRLALREYCKNH